MTIIDLGLNQITQFLIQIYKNIVCFINGFGKQYLVSTGHRIQNLSAMNVEICIE